MIDGVFKFHNRSCLPNVFDLKQQIMDKGHKTIWAIHRGMIKMYQDLKKMYMWMGIKTLGSMSTNTYNVSGLKQYARSQWNYFNHYRYQSKNGRISQWTTSSDFLVW